MSNMSKKKLYAMMALVIVISILGTGTLAYFTTRAVVHNVITSSGVKIELVETMLDDEGEEIPFENQDGIMPGQEVSKIVRVTNRDAKAWVRVRVTETINDRPDRENLITMNCNLGKAPTQWTQKGEWFYYNKPLENGETTEPLFKGVTLAGKEMGNQYENATIDIVVEAEAIQYANNEDFDKAWPDTKTIEEAIY